MQRRISGKHLFNILPLSTQKERKKTSFLIPIFYFLFYFRILLRASRGCQYVYQSMYITKSRMLYVGGQPCKGSSSSASLMFSIVYVEMV